MGREGPCFHCGINRTPLWRPGPPTKPVLCNACGSRWRTSGKLDDYIPKHGKREIQSYQLPSVKKPRLLARDDQKLEVGVEISGQNGSSACLEEEMNNISSLGSAGSSSYNCIQMEETNGEADKDPLRNLDSAPRRKRSKLRQYILSPVERLQRQLFNILQEQGFEEEDTLIYEKNRNIPHNEIGPGSMLLVSPTTIIERSTSQSPMEEDNASCSMNVPVENSDLINNNVLDHVAMQNETTGNEGGKAKARENRIAPHMDTTSRIPSQKLYPPCACHEAKVRHPVKRPRGRPRLSNTPIGHPVKRPRGRPRLSTTPLRHPVKRPRGRPRLSTTQG